MPLNIRSEEVNQLAEKLASRAGVSKTEAVRIALENEMERRSGRVPLAERLKPLLDRMDAVPVHGPGGRQGVLRQPERRVMFVDASALVAILTAEPERSVLLDRLDGAVTPLTSGIAIFETVVAVARKKAMSVADAEAEVEDVHPRRGSAQSCPSPATEALRALTAHARFGKGRHPARLNLGDCFAYACAQVHGVPLLSVGDDFPQTDIRSALG